ncbi:AF4/FMR2 family member lilli [Anopheles stephensi]|uniref:Uncharacterized protein n=1 Tax=Anopheles stephensi TaxID=30069 RepID=A0A182YAP6_ANOST|nr:AF4/FMR2 family member lilli [Anopheles stephensi]XP_035897426.1 AF4/FMR2 family member lilli [Anopheles stephensi]
MTQTSHLIVLVCLVTAVAAIPVRQSQLLSAMQNVQRQYDERSGKEAAGYLQELETEAVDQEPDSGKASSSPDAEQSSAGSRREGTIPTAIPLPNLRKNKMLGYFGMYSPAALSAAAAAAYAQPYGYPLYHSMLDYYDDYLPVDNYPSLNMLANMQTYPQNVYANMANGLGSYQTMSNLSPNLQQQLNSLVQQQQQQQQQVQQQQQQQQQSSNPQLANLAGLDANAASLGSFQSLAASFAAGNDNFQGLEDEDILSRHSQAGRRRPAVKNSPIYYIRLPPTPYMFVPGVGYISQPPTIQPMAAPVPQYPQLAPPPPVTMSPFYQLPINFVSNGKPSGIYQWNGAPAAPAAPPQPTFALPYPRPQRPAFAPSPFIQDSKITHLKGPFLFNGRPEEIFLLQNTFNPLFQSPLNSYY